MKIVVLSGSPRGGANTDTMVEAFAETAREGGNTVEVVRCCQQENRWLPGVSVLLRP